MKKINNVNFSKNNFPSKEISEYDNLKVGYKYYLELMKKSDLCNSASRYQQEFVILEQLCKLASKNGAEEDIKKYEAKMKEVEDKLSEWGMHIN